MYDLIKSCSDVFYDSFDKFLVEFRVIFGFSLFVFIVLIGVFSVLVIIHFIFETLKDKLISRKQRKVDKDV